MIEIKHRFTGAVILRSETAASIRQALGELVAAEPHQAWRRGEADGVRANLADANLAGANLARHPDVPVIEHLDARILGAIAEPGATLDMATWHADGSCGTTHCRAGWAVHLAGKAGYELERRSTPQHAGASIYRASTGRVPHFFGSNEAALADLRRCAARDPLPAVAPEASS